MWILFGFISAFLLGIYEICKKKSVQDNSVLPVLCISMICSTLLLIPIAVPHIPSLDIKTHLLIFIKACMILGSGLCSYYGIKNVPLTIASPIGATRPMWVILGAVIIFGERLTIFQWCAISLVTISFFVFSTIGKKEKQSFNNKYILLVIAGMLLGAASGIYDKYLLRNINRYAVQFYYALEQAIMMLIIVGFIWCGNKKILKDFKWKWSIVGISLFWVATDLAYFYALSQPDAMLSILSAIRRTGTIIPFMYGVFVMHDKNIVPKAIALTGVLIGVIALALG